MEESVAVGIGAKVGVSEGSSWSPVPVVPVTLEVGGGSECECCASDEDRGVLWVTGQEKKVSRRR